jgi:galactokinase
MTRYRAPGRINLIGEHTDYNLGYVLPLALDRDCVVTRTPRDDRQLRLSSEQLGDSRTYSLLDLPQVRTGHWTDYCAGVARELLAAGYPLAGADLHIDSQVPTGAGLSSSAALEVSTALALLNGTPVGGLELAQCCQRAESNFVGMPCGIMDQAIAVLAQAGAALLIDCRSLETRPVPLPEGIAIIVTDSGVKHALASSAYATRVEECRQSAAAAGVSSLRDATLDQVVLNPRGRHVVSENQRVLDFLAAAACSDLIEMGRLFTASHRSLQHDYEVSCEELDFLVDTALMLPGVLGSRMTGGGFGGCTVTLVHEVMAGQFAHAISARFESRYGRRPTAFRARASAGAGPIHDGPG